MANCIYKYKGKEYTKEEFYSLVRTTMVQPRTVQKYEKILFPTGNTASKVEGHTTLEEFKREKEDRISYLQNRIAEAEESNRNGISPKVWEAMKNIGIDGTLEENIERNKKSRLKIIDDAKNEIAQLKQELERVETEGFGALRPIFNFYENTVTNILKKQGYNPVEITDEYGNTWNEILINKIRDNIYLSSTSFASQVLSPENYEIFKRLQTSRLVTKTATPFTITGTNSKQYSIPKLAQEIPSNRLFGKPDIIYRKDYMKKKTLDDMIKRNGWDWIRTRETNEAIMVELGDFHNDQLKIFDSVPSETQSSPANPITQKKVLSFLKNIGFTDIQSVKTLVHNGEELEGDAYVNMLTGVMQIVEGKENVTLPEEAMHILVELIQKSDPVLFRAMEKQVVDYELYRAVLRDPAYTQNKLYKTSSGNLDYAKLKKEVMAKLLAEYLIGNNEGTIESRNKVVVINTWWNQILHWIKKIFGKYSNPFKEALAQIEEDNKKFGLFSDIADEDLIFMSATKKTVDQRDEEYSATRAVFERIRDLAEKAGITKVNNKYYKDGKRWSFDSDELAAMDITELASAAATFNITPSDNKEKTIAEIKKVQGRRVSDKKEAFYNTLFRGKPLDESLRPSFNKMAEEGTFLHAIIEDCINSLIDPSTGLLRNTPQTPNSSLATNKTELNMQLTINKFIKGFIAGFQEGTRFLTETVVYDDKVKELGTIDLLAIVPVKDEQGNITGEKIDIYDWKSMLFKELESIKDYKKEAFNIQLNEYKRILRDNYDIKDFGKIRAIPVNRIYGQEVDGVKPLAAIQIGDPDASKITDVRLRPIISTEESTGNDEKDKIITKLNGIYQSFVDKLKRGKLDDRQILADIDSAIYELRVSNSAESLRIYLKDLEGKVSALVKSIDENKSVDKDVLDEYLMDISLYQTIFESIGDVRYLSTDKTIPLEDRQKLSNVIITLDTDIRNLIEKRKKLLNAQAESSGIFGLLSPEKIVKGITKWFRSLGNHPIATLRYLYELTNRSYTRIAIETDEELKYIENLRYRFGEYMKRTGLSSKDAIGKFVNFEKGTLHSKVDKSFFEERDKVFESRNKNKINKFIADNYNYKEYAKWYQAELKKNVDFWSNQIYDLDPKENEKIKKIKRINFEKNYNIDKFPLTAFSPYNKQLWNKNIREELWLSEEYKEIQADIDLSDMYKFFMKKNKELFDIGAIEEWKTYSFLPNVKKTYADIFSFEDSNYLAKVKNTTVNELKNWKKSLTVEDYELNYSEQRHPITGERTGQRFVPYISSLDNTKELFEEIGIKLGIDKKPDETIFQAVERWKKLNSGNTDKFENEVIKKRSSSFDLFSIYGLMSQQISKEKYLQENDEIIKALIHIEKAKQNFETNMFGRIAMKGNVPVLPDNLVGQNLDLFLMHAKAISEGQSIQVDTDTAISLGLRQRWNNSWMGKYARFDIDPDTYKPTSISTTKFLMWMNSIHQKRVLGINLSSALSNFLGGTFSTNKIYSKYVGKEDLNMAHSQMTSVAFYQSEDMKKRAALVDYFLPLLNNREAYKAGQLSVNASVKILSQEWLMMPMRTSEEIVQLNIFLAHLENTGLIDGKLVNLREMAANETNYFDRFHSPKADREAIEKAFNDRLKELKNQYKLIDKATFKKVKINGKDETIVEIPGVDRNSDTVHQLRTLTQTMSKDALGSMDEFDIAAYRYNIIGRLFMTFKNWIPRMYDVRFGEFHYSQSHHAHEYGRFRMLWRVFATNWLASTVKILPIPGIGKFTNKLGHEAIIQKAIKIYDEKKRIAQDLGQYNDDTFLTEGEFVEMFIRGTEASFAEFRIMTIMTMLLISGLMAPDDDDDVETKSAKSLLRRQVDKTRDEVSFFYNPRSMVDIVASPAPVFGLIKDTYNLIEHVGKNTFGMTLKQLGAEETGEEMMEKAKPLKYTFKLLPVLRQVVNYMPIIDSDIAKDWDIKIQNRNGF